MTPKRFWIGLALITAAALAWRVGYVLWNVDRIALGGDASYYHYQANDIADGRWFIDPFQYRYWGRITPSAGHPPAYLLYLAGVSTFSGASELTLRLASTLLGAGAIFMLGVVGRRAFRSAWAGLIGAALAAAYASLWINDEMLMSESMYVLTTAIAVWAAYKFWDSPTWKTALLMGGAIGLAALSRAEAGILLLILAVPFALFQREQAWGQRIKLAVLACIAGGVMLAPWVGYNLTRFDHPVAMSNGIGSVLMVANCDYNDPVTGEYQGTYHGRYVGYWNVACSFDLGPRLDAAYSKEQAAEYKRELGLLPGTQFAFFGDESTHEVGWRAVGIEEMKNHKRQMPRIVALRVARMWDFYRVRQNIDLNGALEGRGIWQSRLGTIQYFVMLPLAILGLVVMKRRKEPILPFLAFAVSVTITAAMTFGITRYRAPVDALIPVLAGGALVWLFEKVRVRRRSLAPGSDEPVAEPAPA
jgi:4-amino-4-deoxy-L-arabinose transferase-like glycosyltransferase